MIVLLIIACIAAEQFLVDYQHHRSADWFSVYTHRIGKLSLPVWMKTGVGGVIAVLLPPLLAVALIQEMLDGLWGGGLQFIFAGLVLLYCLGPRDLDSDVVRYIEARDTENEDKATEAARYLIGDEPPVSEPALSARVVESVLIQPNIRWYGVIFWFVVLGPLGAVIYRLTNLLQRPDPDTDQSMLRGTSRRLSAILDWIPARITAFTYALAGNFEDALHRWQNCSSDQSVPFEDAAAQLLICAGSGAVGFEAESGEHVRETDLLYMATASMGLAWRALVIWVILIGIVSLTGWI